VSEDKSKALYFIGILPPQKIQDEITAFKEVVRKQFNSSRALNAPPHITLIPPFWFEHAKEATLQEHLSKFNQEFRHFEIELNDFGAFPPRTIYINVAGANLTHCLNQLRLHFAELQLSLLKKFGFHAHITLANKDLTPTKFPEAEAFFQSMSYRRDFQADRASLFRLRNKRWREI